MKDKELTIIEEEWGLQLVASEGSSVNDLNLLPRIREVISLAREKGKNRIMINAIKIRRTVSLTNLYLAGELLLELKTAGFRIALVAPHLKLNEQSRFMENVGYNRGTFIKYFSDQEEALTWIKSQGDR